MKKIAEMTANELIAFICKIAGPAENLFSDGAVMESLKEMKERIPENATVETVFSMFTAIMFPRLTGEAHKKDTFAILAALDGVSVEEIEGRNGLETMRDMFVVFVVDRDVETIFRPCAEARGK